MTAGMMTAGPMTAARRRGRRRRSAAVYWRRRVVALAVMGGVFAVVRPAAGAITGGSGGAGVPARPIAVKTYVVQPGDSLWTAARHLAPGTDPRKVVQALEDARHHRVVVPGEVLSWTP